MISLISKTILKLGVISVEMDFIKFQAKKVIHLSFFSLFRLSKAKKFKQLKMFDKSDLLRYILKAFLISKF